jgi:translation initiation factor 2B subunit (eIF-2B alpha/beta/delta family)
MPVATLATLVTAVRAEAGHALTPSQGLNTLETLKHIIRRTEYELWTAISWPTLVTRWDLKILPGQVEYQYPADMQYEQIRHVYWAQETSTQWHPVEFGIPEDAIMQYGEASKVQTGCTIQVWDTYYNTDAQEERLRVWPTPTVEGTLRLKGQRALNCLVDDADCCTLDPTLITLFASAELLQRSKAEDAQGKMQKAQRHLTKLLANRVSNKQKISTFGSSRGARSAFHRLRPGIEYIP